MLRYFHCLALRAAWRPAAYPAPGLEPGHHPLADRPHHRQHRQPEPNLCGLLGSGRLNAGTAVQAPHPILSMGGYTVNGQANGRPVLGNTASLAVTLQNDWWDALGVTGRFRRPMLM